MKYRTKLYILAAAIILAVVLLFFLFRNSEEPPDAGGGLPADVEDGQIDVSLNLEEGQGGESTITDDGAAPIKLEAKPFIPVKQNDQPILIPADVEPLVKKYGRACVAPNIIKQWSVKGTDVKSPTREMTNYCNNNSACVFIWAEDDRSSFYACNGNGSFKYNRDYWVKTKR